MVAHFLLLAICGVSRSGAVAIHPPSHLKVLGPARSVLALLRAGDFEHLARRFTSAEGILALTLPGSRQRCLVVHETRTDLARRACASPVLKDRVSGDVAFPGLTRQRDGERYAAAKTALNAALCGADARRRIGDAAFAAAFDADHIYDDDAYALCVARLALRGTLFGGDEDTATAFLGPAALAMTAPPAAPPTQGATRARVRVAARQAKLLLSNAPFFAVVDGFTNVDAKTLRARRGVRSPAPAAAAAFRAATEAAREAAIAARRRRGAGADGASAVARLCADASLEDADVAAALWDLIVAGTATTAELASEGLKRARRSPDTVDASALVEDVARAEREKRAVAPLIFRVACGDGMLGDVPLRTGDGVVASLRLAPGLSFGAGRRACAGREVALVVAAAAVEARLSDGVAKIT